MDKENIGSTTTKGERPQVILLHVDSAFNVEYSYFNMGLLSMATILRDAGYKVKCLGIHQLYYMSHVQLRKLFMMNRPAIAGFYTVSDNYNQVNNMACNIKRWSPRTMTIVGGPLATSLGADMLAEPSIDACLVGEGEGPILSLADLKVKGEGDISSIPGLIYREGKQVVTNAPNPPIADLDALPYPDHSLVGIQKIFHVVSGRGCPYNCIFCFQGVHGLKYRHRSAQSVTGEIIENLESHPYKAFDVIDDTFISSPGRVKQIAKGLVDYRQTSGRDFIFFCQGRVDIMDKHPEMIPELAGAGLARLQVGLESGSQKVLDIYKKRINHDMTRRVARQVWNVRGMCLIGNFILGGPFEDEQTYQATEDLAAELLSLAPGCVEINAFFMGPYPGTLIASQPEKYGLSVVDDRFVKGLTLSDVHMTTDTFDVNGVRELRRRFFKRVESTMESLVSKIPRDMLGTHFQWAWNFGLSSLWYLNFLSKREALSAFFRYLESPRYKMLEEIQPGHLSKWYAQRVQEGRGYSRDGRGIILPVTNVKATLTDPDEILVYELASGKLTVEQMAVEYVLERGSELEPGEVIHQVFMPIFKKLDRLYQLVFYR